MAKNIEERKKDWEHFGYFEYLPDDKHEIACDILEDIFKYMMFLGMFKYTGHLDNIIFPIVFRIMRDKNIFEIDSKKIVSKIENSLKDAEIKYDYKVDLIDWEAEFCAEFVHNYNG